MKYIQIQRSSYEGIITIGEYLKLRQLNTYIALHLMMREMSKRSKDVTEQVIAAADVSGVYKHYARIMQERPLPGRGGLLPGEKEDVL